MPKKPSSPAAGSKQSNPIKCEDCRNFTGMPFLFRFSCAKAHEPDSLYSMTKVECSDNDPLSREELIFRRFKSSAWSQGDTPLKNKKASVRRTATSLRATITEFGAVLTTDQVNAIGAAAIALDRLGEDIVLASRLAKKFKEDQDARYARERQVKLEQIAERYFGIAGSAKVLEIAADLAVFFSRQGIDWFKHHRGDLHAYFYANENIEAAVSAYRADPTEMLLVALKIKCAKCFEGFGIDGGYHSSSEPTVADFEAFRVWLAAHVELTQLIAADDKIVQLKPPRRR